MNTIITIVIIAVFFIAMTALLLRLVALFREYGRIISEEEEIKKRVDELLREHTKQEERRKRLEVIRDIWTKTVDGVTHTIKINGYKQWFYECDSEFYKMNSEQLSLIKSKLDFYVSVTLTHMVSNGEIKVHTPWNRLLDLNNAPNTKSEVRKTFMKLAAGMDQNSKQYLKLVKAYKMGIEYIERNK